MSSQGPPSAIIREAEKLFLFRRMGLTPSPSRYSNKNGNKIFFFNVVRKPFNNKYIWYRMVFNPGCALKSPGELLQNNHPCLSSTLQQ